MTALSGFTQTITGSASFTSTHETHITGDTGLVLQDLTFPSADGTSGQAITTDGAGLLSFSTVSSNSKIIDSAAAGTTASGAYFDTTTASAVAAASTGTITMTSTGTFNVVASAVVLDGLTYPTSDGTSGQSITTDGAGTLSFTTVGGGSDVTAVYTSILTGATTGNITCNFGKSNTFVTMDCSETFLTMTGPGGPTSLVAAVAIPAAYVPTGSDFTGPWMMQVTSTIEVGYITVSSSGTLTFWRAAAATWTGDALTSGPHHGSATWQFGA
ncbi:MAG: hypothetical protein JKY23_04420 [Nitrospinaceae bacterium]|nr:hypothetical protein [Nitrospinaceae bacterium]